MSEAEQNNPPATPPETPLDVTRAVWQLRAVACGLGAAVLVLSLAFNGFVWKQIINVTALTNNRLNQLTPLRTSQQRLEGVINELASYSVGKPELMAVFKRHGAEISGSSTGVLPAAASPSR